MLRILSVLLLGAAPITLAQAPSAVWLDVPFVKQPVEGCGAASIAMIMRYWEQQRDPGATARDEESAGPPADVARIQQALYSKHAHGIYASDLKQYLESQGFTTYVVDGDQALLAQHLARGRPLIVALKPTSAQALHFVVVAGVDPDERMVLVNDPAQRKLLKVDSAAFEKEWHATGNWTLLAVPRSAQR